MSCRHGNHPDACDICDEVDAAYESGRESATALAQNTQGEVEPVAWMRESGAPAGSETSVITKVIRDLWLQCNPLLVERYTIPLYLHAERATVPDLKTMVDRFLGWTLPKDFMPDAGISFKPVLNPHGDPYSWPTGTNLLNADQARVMFEYVLAAAPSQPEDAQS